MTNENFKQLIENLHHFAEDEKNGWFYKDHTEEDTVIEYSINEENNVLWLNISEKFIPKNFEAYLIEENVAPYIFPGEVAIPEKYDIKYKEWDELD